MDTLVDDEENAYGLRCVAVPLRLDDDVLGAASVSGATGELAPESEESLASTRR
ncbi:IclR family transcriptional regulator domain-containing protein [Phytoactinopolyspora alkaliphila]|uniref:IclR family transcriptional regulator domain-containing protein n=1 Tax=Phytoactinopolyspora alkaliphila TaxID=1783498 RepID=UPI001C204690